MSGKCKVRGTTQTTTREVNEQFLDWFVAFAEGDGGFYYSNSGGYERLFFKIRQKNRRVLDYIHSNLRLGSVTRPSDGYYTYQVSARPEILVLYQIFNGRLLLAKTNQRFIDNWASKINTAYGVKLTYLGPGQFKGLSNAALAGLTDSDGSFGITVRDNDKVIISWSFDQSFEKPFLDNMCITLGMGRVERKVPSESGYAGEITDDAWRFTVESLQDSIILNDYFSKHPLMTDKASTRHKHWSQVLYWKLYESASTSLGRRVPPRAVALGRQGPSVVQTNLNHIREYQRLNSLLT